MQSDWKGSLGPYYSHAGSELIDSRCCHCYDKMHLALCGILLSATAQWNNRALSPVHKLNKDSGPEKQHSYW